MLHIFARKSDDVSYFTSDPALELDTLRDGGPGWWLRGEGDLSDPQRMAQVFGASSRGTTLGYDLIFSAPRSISVLLAIDEVAARGVIKSHRLAVKSAVEYLEVHALGIRRKIEGETEILPARWREIAAYTHGVNRSGDPHLHDHVLVGASQVGSDRAFDSRGLFAHLEAADALYRCELRWRVGESTSYIPWRSFLGNELVVGVDDGYRAIWSGRSPIRQEKRLWSRDQIVSKWTKDLEGFRRFGEREKLPELAFDEHSFASQLSRSHAIFRRSAVIAFANAATFGIGAPVLNNLVDMHLGDTHRGLGVQEAEVSRAALLQLGKVREVGPRPLDLHLLTDWIFAVTLTKSRVVEPRRELYPARSLRGVQPKGISLSSSRDISDAKAASFAP